MSDSPNKTKLIIGGAVVGVLVIVVILVNLSGGEAKTPELSAAEQRAAEIQAAQAAEDAKNAANPANAPAELPTAGRPPRGGAAPAK